MSFLTYVVIAVIITAIGAGYVNYRNSSSKSDEVFIAIVIGVIWPIGLPIYLSYMHLPSLIKFTLKYLHKEH